MKFKLGIYGSAAGDMSTAMPLARELGKILGGYADKLILITGACPGIPYAVITEAAPSGIEIWGFSSFLDFEGQKQDYPDDDNTLYKKLIYVPEDFPFVDDNQVRRKYRNVTSTASCDAAIIISGRWGTLNEFTNLIDYHKAIGVLTGTGGIADELPGLSKKITKEGQGPIIFDSNPKQLVEALLTSLNNQST